MSALRQSLRLSCISEGLTPPRTLALVLADLRHAKADWVAAVDAPLGSDWDARMTDAERRTERLLAEFKEMIFERTGVEWSAITSAIEDAVL